MHELSVYEKEEAHLWPPITDKYAPVKKVDATKVAEVAMESNNSSHIHTRKRVTHQINLDSITPPTPLKIRRKRWG
jgi:hypothetical protein